MKKKQYTINVDLSVAKAVESYAKDHNITNEEAIVDCLEDYYGQENEAGYDPIFDEIKSDILNYNNISAVFLQRHYQIGYRRSCRLLQQLEYAGYVKSQGQTKPYRVIKSN